MIYQIVWNCDTKKIELKHITKSYQLRLARGHGCKILFCSIIMNHEEHIAFQNALLCAFLPRVLDIIIETENKDLEECAICLETMSKKVTLSCKHNFHKLCIENWVKENNNCPLCRHEFNFPMFFL